MIRIDLDAGWLEIDDPAGPKRLPLDSPDAFAIASRAWLRCGWDTKYVYSFTWMGRPIIQLPDDMVRIQEVIYRVKPDVLVETGIAHGGSLVFYASLFKAMGRGRVVGVDIEIRPHNRRAIEQHEMFPLLELIEGSSIDPAVVARVKSSIQQTDRVMIVLDSRHTHDHVLAELKAYAPMVTPNSYIVATDGIMADLVGAPRSAPDWSWNNPKEAALEFVRQDTRFVVEEPEYPFNEGSTRDRVTYWPSAYIRRKAQ